MNNIRKYFRQISFSVLFALQPTAPALAAGLCLQALVAPAAPGHVMSIDESDVEINAARQGLKKNIRNALYGDEYKAQAADSESVKQLKLLLSKREFATWFRFNDEVSRELNNDLGHLRGLVKHVQTAQEGIMAKIMMIRQAKYTVDLTYYIFDVDEAGLVIVQELKDAIKRGVNVRVMVDSLGSMKATLGGNQHFKSLQAYAEKNAGFVTDPGTGLKSNLRARVEVLTFSPVTNVPAWFRSGFVSMINYTAKALSKDPTKYVPMGLTHWSPNRRTHDKLLLADAAFPELSIAIMGGRNISNHYYELDPTDHENFRDIEVLIRNNPEDARTMSRHQSIGEILNDHYDRIYFHRANRKVSVGLRSRLFGTAKIDAKMSEAQKKVATVTADGMRRISEDYSQPEFGQNYLNSGFVNQQLDFLNNTQNLIRSLEGTSRAIDQSIYVEDFSRVLMAAKLNKNHQDLMRKIMILMGKEKEAITIVSPYLWLGPRDINIIHQWLQMDPRRTFTVYSNSVVTSDNMPAQALVDAATAPKLLENPATRGQIRFFAYGRADDVNLGGNKYYGKLHFKGAFFKSEQTSIVGTHNKDPRSQLLNSEHAVVIKGAEYSATMDAEIRDIEANSHEWGSAEFKAIRTNPRLPKMKQKIVQYQAELYDMLQKLHLWWLI